MAAETRKAISVLGMVVVVAGLYFARGWFNRFDEIPYRGQSFKLAKYYWSWDEYKDDPQLAPALLGAAQEAVSHGKLTPTYASRWDMIQGTQDLMFPGFGMAIFGERTQSDGSVLAGYAIDIPLADKDRVIVYRANGDTWALIDDFVWSPSGAINHVEEKDKKLVYSDFSGMVVVTREPSVR